MPLRLCFCLLLLAIVPVTTSMAQATENGGKPAIGSSNVASADPAVPHPGTVPCVVTLYKDERFGGSGANTRMDAIPHPFAYHPPEGCKGPWAKVILQSDFSVDPGHQYDRTASIWLGGVNLYFGTTEEPAPDFGPNWRVERDLTDYTSLLRAPAEGAALVNNWIDAKRASIIHSSARLLFYPAAAHTPAPKTPEAVYSLSGQKNVAVNVQTGDDQLARSLTFPRDTVRVYLDVFAQSQFHDEFWYTCLPDKYIAQTAAFAMKRGYAGAPKVPRACNGGSFREVEVSIDGQPAGLAPIYPWVYTGGIDPYLWRPTPGVQTLNFVPYRMDLSPFAGVLGDGAMHQVAVRVLGANHYFSLGAALLMYGSGEPTRGGKVTRNTLAGQALEPVLSSTLGNNGTVSGNVVTRQAKNYVIEGYVDTAKGRVRTEVKQQIDFLNTKKFSTIDKDTTRQITEQTAHADTVSRSRGSGKAAIDSEDFHRSLSYSLTVNSLKKARPDGSSTRTVNLQQVFDKNVEQRAAGQPRYHAHVSNIRTTADTATFNATHTGLINNGGQGSTQTFAFEDSLGDCYQAKVTAQGGKVAAFTQGTGCRGPVKWFVHPDGSPDSFGWRKMATRGMQ